MKVKELIESLKECDPESEVEIITEITHTIDDDGDRRENEGLIHLDLDFAKGCACDAIIPTHN